MYLSEEQRAAVRECLKNQKSKFQRNGSEKGKRYFSDTVEMKKVTQILFDARDGREVFTPFKFS